MALYDVMLEAEGVVYVTVEAESEEEAVRKARHAALIGDVESALEYECVRVAPQGQP